MPSCQQHAIGLLTSYYSVSLYAKGIWTAQTITDCLRLCAVVKNLILSSHVHNNIIHLFQKTYISMEGEHKSYHALSLHTEGEILATFEENTRDFLYPGPRLTPLTSGSEREILMKKSVSFPVCISSTPCAVISLMHLKSQCHFPAICLRT